MALTNAQKQGSPLELGGAIARFTAHGFKQLTPPGGIVLCAFKLLLAKRKRDSATLPSNLRTVRRMTR